MFMVSVVYYETIKRDLNRRLIYECRCDERLKVKGESYLLLNMNRLNESYSSRIPIYECRCDERLKTKSEGSTRLAYTGLLGGLEHLKIKTRL